MGLADQLIAAQSGPGPRCTVALMLESLPAGYDPKDVSAATRNPLVKFSSLARWTQEEEQKRAGVMTVRSEAFSRHRNLECACARTR